MSYNISSSLLTNDQVGLWIMWFLLGVLIYKNIEYPRQSRWDRTIRKLPTSLKTKTVSCFNECKNIFSRKKINFVPSKKVVVVELNHSPTIISI